MATKPKIFTSPTYKVCQSLSLMTLLEDNSLGHQRLYFCWAKFCLTLKILYWFLYFWIGNTHIAINSISTGNKSASLYHMTSSFPYERPPLWPASCCVFLEIFYVHIILYSSNHTFWTDNSLYILLCLFI